jgi:proline iminopeptidase
MFRRLIIILTSLYPEIEPYKSGMLDTGDSNLLYWEECGNPEGKPAVVLHGGPGSGCTPWWRRLFNPRAYRILLFDQRNCGRSKPNASDPKTDLSNNNTMKLISDMEILRKFVGADRWLVMGASWGSTLALAYSETYPERVTQAVLFGVSTGTRKEFDWLFRGGVAIFFPEQWERLKSHISPKLRGIDTVAAYSQMLNDPNLAVRQKAAEAWCEWESVSSEWPPTNKIQTRFADPSFALAFARLVTHYVSHNAWLEDGILLHNAGTISKLSGILIQGRFDFQSPLGNAWDLKKAWPKAELIVVDSGHSPNDNITSEIIRATDRFENSS